MPGGAASVGTISSFIWRRTSSARRGSAEGSQIVASLSRKAARGRKVISGGLPDRLVADEKAEVDERGVAAVQQAKLHRLERRHVGDELRAGIFPPWPRRAETVLDDPFGAEERR